jgi:hypothetical protein
MIEIIFSVIMITVGVGVIIYFVLDFRARVMECERKHGIHFFNKGKKWKQNK